MEASPQPIAAELAFLIGSFLGTDEIHESAWAPASSASASATGAPAIEGTLVVLHLEERRSDGSAFQVVNTFMRDPATDELLLYAFDSLGFPPDPPARGVWDGAQLVLDRTTERGASRTEFAATGEGFRWDKLFRSPDAETWQPVVTGRLARQG